jgi:hypothetical protein
VKEEKAMADEAAEAEAKRLLDVLNETSRRCHTVACNYAATLARQDVLGHAETHAMINGMATAIGVFCGGMEFQRNAAHSDDPRSPEEVLADMIRDQFLAVFRDFVAKRGQQEVDQGASVS